MKQKGFAVLALMLCLNFSACSKPETSSGSAANGSGSKSVSYSVLDAVSYDFPAGWKDKTYDEDNPYGLFCVSGDNYATTGVFLFDANDIDEDVSPLAVFNLQIENLMEQIKKGKLISVKPAKKMRGKTITEAVYSGIFGISKYYYVFSLTEFSESDEFTICAQVCAPSKFKKYEPIFEKILESAALI
ncbi:MAG: hypothetical protein LBQ47_08530 [Endomicrobium sp.]|jgi:hypothetical protein|nr:hypothetical protein [Endomicrobium sp.]